MIGTVLNKGCNYCKFTGKIELYAMPVVQANTYPAYDNGRMILVSIPCPRCFEGFKPSTVKLTYMETESGCVELWEDNAMVCRIPASFVDMIIERKEAVKGKIEVLEIGINR